MLSPEPSGPVPSLSPQRLAFPHPVEAVSPTMSCVAQRTPDGSVKVTFLDGEEMRMAPLPEPPRRLDFSPDGGLLLVDRRQAWDLETGVDIHFPWSQHSPTSHAFLEGNLLAVAYSDGSISLFDLTTGGRVRTLTVAAAGSLSQRSYVKISAAPDGVRLAAVHEGRVMLFHPASGQCELRWEVEGPLMGVCFSPGGRWLALQRVHTAMVRRGRDLVPVGSPSRLLFWDLLSGRPGVELDWEREFAFSRLHPVVATGSRQGSVRLWALDWKGLEMGVAQLTELERLEADGAVDQLEFVGRGHFLAAGTSQGLSLWRL